MHRAEELNERTDKTGSVPFFPTMTTKRKPVRTFSSQRATNPASKSGTVVESRIAC